MGATQNLRKLDEANHVTMLNLLLKVLLYEPRNGELARKLEWEIWELWLQTGESEIL